jgi:putative glutamine amidotransferase
MRPRIAITTDNGKTAKGARRYESAEAYADAVALAGGLPILLPQIPDLIPDYLASCDAFVFTGGDCPDMSAFNSPTDPRVTPVDPRRQSFELALLRAIDPLPHTPVLGICWGMQLMGLNKNAQFNQYLADTLPTASDHQNNARHPINLTHTDSHLGPQTAPGETIVSWHRQALSTPGSLRVVATAPDGVIEAVDDPSRPFYMGVQWHPERGGPGPLSLGILQRLIAAATKRTQSKK